MMLSVENPDTGLLEVAMLLDEPPCRQYMQGAMGGQPWRRNSQLVKAIHTAQLHGHAWLYIVYRGDSVVTWGSKMVKVVSGGKLYMEEKTKLGNRTGKLLELRYETVAEKLFQPVYGNPQTGGTYKVIVDCSLELDPDSGVDIGQPHPLLGYKELRVGSRNAINAQSGNSKDTRFIPQDLGCRVEWSDQNEYGETWILQDASGLQDYRFELTEYQRRTYVNHVLQRLGFVASDLPIRQQQLGAHISNVAQSLEAIASLVRANKQATNDGARATPNNGIGNVNEDKASTNKFDGPVDSAERETGGAFNNAKDVPRETKAEQGDAVLNVDSIQPVQASRQSSEEQEITVAMEGMTVPTTTSPPKASKPMTYADLAKPMTYADLGTLPVSEVTSAAITNQGEQKSAVVVEENEELTAAANESDTNERKDGDGSSSSSDEMVIEVIDG